MTGKLQLEALTGLRFLLALWVVLFHQRTHFGLPGWASALIGTGYAAVGFFFVLSGFVLAYNYPLSVEWSAKDFARFGIGRLARIYPVYLLGLVVMAPVVLLGSHYSPSHAPGVSVYNGYPGGLLSVVLLQAWVPRAALCWNAAGWSLSAEMFFYFCFPLVGVRLWRLSKRRDVLIAGMCMWAAALVIPAGALLTKDLGLATSPADIASSDSLASNFVKFNPLLRLPEFCMGILLARLYSFLREGPLLKRRRGYLLYLPALAGVVVLLSQPSHWPYILVHNGVMLPLYACTILGLALGGGSLARLLGTRLLVFLGGASYALYILHVPFGSWFFGIARRLCGHEVSGPASRVVYVVVAVALSSVVFKFIEEPLNSRLRCSLQTFLNRFSKRWNQSALAMTDDDANPALTITLKSELPDLSGQLVPCRPCDAGFPPLATTDGIALWKRR